MLGRDACRRRTGGASLAIGPVPSGWLWREMFEYCCDTGDRFTDFVREANRVESACYYCLDCLRLLVPCAGLFSVNWLVLALLSQP